MRIADRLIETLTRVTTSGRVVREIDGLRFIAIASVVMYHLLGYVIAKSPAGLAREGAFADTLDRGWFGVILFFTISGLIISLPFAAHYLAGERGVNLPSYYLRRLTRLEPPYFIFVTLIFVLRAWHGDFAEFLPHYISTLTYSHNLVYGEKSTIAEVAWSLEIEIQFYLLAPLIARVFALKQRREILIAIIVGFCALQPFINEWRLSVLAFAHCFLVGFLIADIYVSRGTAEKTYRMDWVALGSVALLYAITGCITRVWWSPGGGMFDAIWCALACVGLLGLTCAAFYGRITHAILANQWIAVVGGMCYTTYLYHEYVISALGPHAMRFQPTRALWVNYAIAWAILMPALLVVASLLFLAFEKPFMQRQWVQRLRGVVTPHTQTR
jgi:peptidoglycan/LPS O-acetylase OafA/YrhL